MKFKLIDLPYAKDALEPVMSEETVSLHHGKHLNGYVNTLNKLIEGTAFEDKCLKSIVKEAEGKMYNQAGQILNHNLFFLQLRPKDEAKKAPTGTLLEAIEKEWGSFEDFKQKFQEEAAGLFGSGWAFLVADKDGKLSIDKGSNAYNPITEGLYPLMTADVWEHAYYVDYRNVRPDFLKALWEIIDWKTIEEWYAEPEQAMKCACKASKAE